MRHGKTNTLAVFPAGNEALSAQGYAQMRHRVAQLPAFDTLISSPYLRCLDFSKSISNENNIPLKTNNDFAEFNFGDWTGKSRQELSENSYFENFLNHPFTDQTAKFLPANSETLSNFKTRVLSAFNTIIQTASEHTLIVTHGGVIRLLLLQVMHIPIENWYRIRVDFASLTQFNVADDGWIELLMHQGETNFAAGNHA